MLTPDPPSDPGSCWTQPDHMDLRTGLALSGTTAALHCLRLQVRGHVVRKQEGGLKLAHSRKGRICDMESKQERIFHYFVHSVNLEQIPENCKTAETPTSFKSRLKSYLFTVYIYKNTQCTFSGDYCWWFSQTLFCKCVMFYHVKHFALLLKCATQLNLPLL